jgi:hypothetical protein
VGYYYQQLTADRGQRAILGSNESRTRGVGPQIGYNFTVGGVSVFTNLRGYTEFGSYPSFFTLSKRKALPHLSGSRPRDRRFHVERKTKERQY